MSRSQNLVQSGRQWDRADIWLVISAVFFVVTLWLELRNPGNIYMEGAHFMADAALVGGIADWFAVTAIFKHPFGLSIPNTAILPNKKSAFAKGASDFVQGLLSEETVVGEIRGMNILGIISSKLKDPVRRETAIAYLLDMIRDRLDEANRGGNIRELANEIRQKLLDYRARDIIRQGLRWLRYGNNGAIVLEWIAPTLKRTINSPDFRIMLDSSFQNLRDNKATGIMDYFVGALEAVNLVSIGDASEVVQAELLNMAAELGVRNSETQRKILRLIVEHADNISRDKKLIRSLDDFRKRLIDKMPLEDALRDIFSKLWRNFKEEESRKQISEHTEKALRSHIAEVLRNQFVLVVDLLRNDSDLQEDLDKFLKGIASTFATEVARSKIGKIIERVIDNMTDEKLNEIVRSKVRDDLMFIRINGVIVGALIGGLLFLGIQAYEKFII